MSILSFLGSMISPVTETVKQVNENRTKLKQADLDIKLAEKENRARLLRDTENNNHDWEMSSLADKDRWLRRASFVLFSGPFLWALFDPAGVKNYFDVALASMPTWYIQLYAAIIGGVWGFSALKNSLPAILGGIKKALKD